ncbi:MAG: patatin-like phospholipase family protein [Alistipes sp.]|jgi:NTE family protein|nr:patatin-like phospholipase family protein [Alistipes sp.]
MKIAFLIVLAAMLATPAFLCAREQGPQPTPEPEPARKKVAVVLSGGGAKGVAHIGALRVLEQAGVPIDIVVGTSMGAIVGGLYSIGYSPDQLDSMVMSQDWGLLLSDRTPRRRQPYSEKENDDRYQVSYPFGKRIEAVGGLIKGTNLEMLFNDLMVGHHDSLDFRRLPIPFACVASNIVDGQPVVFDKGVMPVAMRASMAIPAVFTPVYIDDMVLVDGGMTNNFPTNVARDMGADVIIGVDVQSSLRSKEELVGTAAVLSQIIDLSMQRSIYRSNVDLADVYIRVDVSGYSSASFNLPALGTLIRRGEAATVDRWDDIVKLKREMGVGAATRAATDREPFRPLSGRGSFHVYDVTFDELSPRQRRWVMRKCRIRENSNMNIRRLNHCMTILGAATSHTGIYYSLRDTLEGYNLDFHMDAVKGNSISAGVHFDNEEIASVLVNGTVRLGEKTMPMEASLTGRFGKRLGVTLDYSILASPLSAFKFDYTFSHNDININSGGKRIYNPTYQHHRGSFSFLNMNFLRQSMRMELGVAYQKYKYLNLLTDYRNYEDGGSGTAFEQNLMADLDEELWSYFARVDYETHDSRYFAMRGTALSLGFEVFTDNFYQYKEHGPLSALSLSWKTAIPLTRKFSLIPSAYGRLLSGNDVPFPLLNMVGGKVFGRYMSQQMPFDGIGYMETAPHTFLAAKIQGRQRIARRHYVSASFSYAIASQELLTLATDGRNYFGASLDYGYDMRSFPLQASLSWSSITRSVGFYFKAGYMF